MAVNYVNLVKQNRMQMVTDMISGKITSTSASTNSATGVPTLNILDTNGTTVVASFTLVPANFQVSSTGVLSLTTTTITAVGATGTATTANIKNGSTNIITGLTVGTGTGFDVTINATAISAGQTVTLSSAQITHS